MVPNKDESGSELTEEEILQPESPVEDVEENAVAEGTVTEEAGKHDLEAEDFTKEYVDRLAEQNGIEKALSELRKCRVLKLRNLAREYDGLQIAGREISKANKMILLEELKKYYNKEN